MSIPSEQEAQERKIYSQLGDFRTVEESVDTRLEAETPEQKALFFIAKSLYSNKEDVSDRNDRVSTNSVNEAVRSALKYLQVPASYDPNKEPVSFLNTMVEHMRDYATIQSGTDNNDAFGLAEVRRCARVDTLYRVGRPDACDLLNASDRALKLFVSQLATPPPVIPTPLV